ncbi:endo-beta-N-acetylglucosaminidase H [Lysobacter enzymogenes]|uniref:Endo-beta-N-acetylglucosaminidase H n=1 Tax=Lysobacter enzymogenes TaxID=69 RepID=A0A0S2DKP3_LYSEN
MFGKSALLAVGLMAFFGVGEASARNVVFLNNPSPQDVKDVGKYLVSGTGQPFFSDLVLFAANINGSTPNTPVLYYNAEMSAILKDNLSIVRGLQAQGIKVQISYLGNHQNAGWSCNMSSAAATKLANAMVADVVKYGLDGISVDDEYSQCSGNAKAFYSVLKAIRANSKFAGKTLSKALWSDSSYFRSPSNAADYLTEGYEMTYAGSVSYLAPYVGYGMSKNALFLGISPQFSPASSVRSIAQDVEDDGYQGVMIWAPNAFLDTASASAYYTQIVKAQAGEAESVEYVP